MLWSLPLLAGTWFAAHPGPPPPFVRLGVRTLIGVGATIEYAVPSFGCVQLTVYDLRGAPVAQLVDQNLPAGTYHYRWRPERRGVYFVALQHSHRTVQRRVIVAP